MQQCRACPIGAMATQAVGGEGPSQPRVMFVGEQPGDQEDLQGRPFVGPAGQLLVRAFERLAISRSYIYLTNAVRNFKYELRGKRRIHKTAAQMEAAACAHWLEKEISLVQPRTIVALGATAAQTLIGPQFRVTKQRGEFIESTLAPYLMATVHPSSILRAPDDETRQLEYRHFVADLKKLARVIK
jgi:DNA polymerase